MLDRHGYGLPPYDRMAPGPIKGLQLVAAGIEQARAELVGRGVEVGANRTLRRAGLTESTSVSQSRWVVVLLVLLLGLALVPELA